MECALSRPGWSSLDMRCLFAVNVWGRSYIDNFIRLTLPTHLAPGNLQDLPDAAQSEYLIYTRAEDVPQLSSAPQLRALREIVPVKIETVDITAGNKYGLLGGLQARCLRYAVDHGFDAVFLLYPDLLCSAGSFRYTIMRLREGYLGVVSLAPQVVDVPVTSELLSGRFASGNHALAVPSRALADIVLRNLHPTRAPSFWEIGKFTNMPALIFWRVPGEGVLAHAFHLHPIGLAVQNQRSMFASRFHGTLDENYLPRLFNCADMLHVVTDSDDLFLCSVDALEDVKADDLPGYYVERDPSVAKVACFAEGHAAPLHREFFSFDIRIHGGDIDPSKWRPVQERAKRIVTNILLRLGLPDDIVKFEDPAAYDGRRYRRRLVHALYAGAEWRQSNLDLALNLLARFIASLPQLQRLTRFVTRPSAASATPGVAATPVQQPSAARGGGTTSKITSSLVMVRRALRLRLYDPDLHWVPVRVLVVTILRRMLWR
jgi:hypothetical protein